MRAVYVSNLVAFSDALKTSTRLTDLSLAFLSCHPFHKPDPCNPMGKLDLDGMASVFDDPSTWWTALGTALRAMAQLQKLNASALNVVLPRWRHVTAR